jgi:GR25 family glycosyltransferase involved in LPS biosynthesis
MKEDELKYLFNKYLNREYNISELFAHGYKNYNDFEIEIQNCDEYKKTKKGGDKKRIGILLSGHIRNLAIVDSIDNFLKNYNYDIFIHTWDNIGTKGTETNLDANAEEKNVEEYIKNIKNLKRYTIENNKEFIMNINRKEEYVNFSSPEEFIKSQLYSINKSYKLMLGYSISENIKYDIIIKARFDCVFTTFDLNDIIVNNINNYKIIFTPDGEHAHPDYRGSCWACDNMYYGYNLREVHIFEHTNVICDLYAYGSMQSMAKYCDLYNNYDDLLKKYVNINKEQLKKLNIKEGENGTTILTGHQGHINSIYYFYCSYPERLLQIFLKEYMLVKSQNIKIRLTR